MSPTLPYKTQQKRKKINVKNYKVILDVDLDLLDILLSVLLRGQVSKTINSLPGPQPELQRSTILSLPIEKTHEMPRHLDIYVLTKLDSQDVVLCKLYNWISG